ncbi:hypothetical protein SNEBB_011017 [Seison nebaliae]|nr:hypothetical protein SNEBB_011017 [Seison nebaliae]
MDMNFIFYAVPTIYLVVVFPIWHFLGTPLTCLQWKNVRRSKFRLELFINFGLMTCTLIVCIYVWSYVHLSQAYYVIKKEDHHYNHIHHRWKWNSSMCEDSKLVQQIFYDVYNETSFVQIEITQNYLIYFLIYLLRIIEFFFLFVITYYAYRLSKRATSQAPPISETDNGELIQKIQSFEKRISENLLASKLHKKFPNPYAFSSIYWFLASIVSIYLTEKWQSWMKDNYLPIDTLLQNYTNYLNEGSYYCDKFKLTKHHFEIDHRKYRLNTSLLIRMISQKKLLQFFLLISTSLQVFLFVTQFFFPLTKTTDINDPLNKLKKMFEMARRWILKKSSYENLDNSPTLPESVASSATTSKSNSSNTLSSASLTRREEMFGTLSDYTSKNTAVGSLHYFSRQHISSIFSQISFQVVNRIIKLGRLKRLYDEKLRLQVKYLNANYIFGRFDNVRKNSNREMSTRTSLSIIILKTFPTRFICVILLKIMGDIINFFVPVILKALLELIREKYNMEHDNTLSDLPEYSIGIFGELKRVLDTMKGTLPFGYKNDEAETQIQPKYVTTRFYRRRIIDLCLLLFFTNIFSSLLFQHFIQYSSELILQVKMLLTKLIYKKTLVLPPKTTISNQQIESNSKIKKIYINNSKEEKPNDTSSGNILTLMSVDSLFSARALFSLFSFISLLLSLMIVFIFLYKLLGSVALVVFIIPFFHFPLTIFLMKRMENAQNHQMYWRGRRLHLINDFISRIKLIKMNVWEAMLIKKVRTARREEFSYLKKMTYYSVVIDLLWTSLPQILSILLFFLYLVISEGADLTVEKLFVTLSLLNILQTKLSGITEIIQTYVQGKASFLRIIKFLNNSEQNMKTIKKEFDTIPNNVKADIFMKNCYFCEFQSNDYILRNISLQFQKNSVIAIIGDNNGGRRELLNALAGFYRKKHGTFGKKTDMRLSSFLPEISWTMNGTIRENIIMNNKWNESKFWRIIQVCCLDNDLDELPLADKTICGEEGMKLSGGQKQRLSIARALYDEHSNLIVLDMPFSALDCNVTKRLFLSVFHQLTRNEFLKEKIVIMTMNELFLLPFVDNIILMSDGRIIEQGNYENLKEAKVESKILNYITENEKHSTKSINVNMQDLKSAMRLNTIDLDQMIDGYQNTRRRSTNNSELSEAYILERCYSDSTNSLSVSSTMTLSDIDGISDEKCEQLRSEENLSYDKISWAYIRAYLKYIGYGLLLLVVFLYTIQMTCAVSANLILSKWRSKSRMMNESEPNFSRLIIYSSLNIFQSSLILFYGIILGVGILFASNKLNNNLLLCISSWSYTRFSITTKGCILNRFSDDITECDMRMVTAFTSSLTVVFEMIGIVLVLCYSNFYMIFFVVLMLILFLYIERTCVTIILQLKRLEAGSRTGIYNHFCTTLNGLIPIKASRLSAWMTNQLNNFLNINQSYQYYRLTTNRWLVIRLEVLGSAIILLVSLLLFFCSDGSDLTAGYYAFVLTYALKIITNVTRGTRTLVDLELIFVAVERILNFIGIPSKSTPSHGKRFKSICNVLKKRMDNISVRQPSGSLKRTLQSIALTDDSQTKLFTDEQQSSSYKSTDHYDLYDVNRSSSSTSTDWENWQVNGHIHFQNVALGYHSSDQAIIENICIDIEPGKKVCLVGRTGGGKSTLFLALFRLIRILEGKICIDNVDIKKIDIKILRRNISILSQGNQTFLGSIRENLDPDKRFSDLEIWQSLKSAGVDTLIRRLPGELNYELDDSNSINIPHAELQLLALARLILEDNRIILLDEATSHMSSETSNKLLSFIFKHFHTSTIIIITHRLHTIKQCDTIYRIENRTIFQM